MQRVATRKAKIRGNNLSFQNSALERIGRAELGKQGIPRQELGNDIHINFILWQIVLMSSGFTKIIIAYFIFTGSLFSQEQPGKKFLKTASDDVSSFLLGFKLEDL